MENEEKYRVLFDNEIYAICIFDPETLQPIDANEAMTRLCGYSRDELLSLRFTDIAAEPEATTSLIDQINKTQKAIRTSQRLIRNKDGTLIPVEGAAYPREWNGRKVVFAILRDIIIANANRLRKS
jgi:PAS domain S-box-containing protein